MKAAIYRGDDDFDLVAPTVDGVYHVLAFKREDVAMKIVKARLIIGGHAFVPGEWYDSIGTGKKTSAGFTTYRGEPLRFIGVYKDNALFVTRQGPFSFKEYPVCYWSWIIARDEKAFIALTNKSAARAMEL